MGVRRIMTTLLTSEQTNKVANDAITQLKRAGYAIPPGQEQAIRDQIAIGYCKAYYAVEVRKLAERRVRPGLKRVFRFYSKLRKSGEVKRHG